MAEIICTVCPRGCHLHVDEALNVTGNFCKRGEVYGKNELTNPKRTITSTVKIISEKFRRLPVKTSKPIPKDKIFTVMEILNHLEAHAPVATNDVLLHDVLALGADIVATRTIEK